MTAQFAEVLIYEGEHLPMCSNPLEEYFSRGGMRPEFHSTSTALWRGYVGTWKIIDGRLYLIKLDGELEDGRDVDLSTVFPEFTTRVFAHWYSGTIRIPQGKQIEYVHMGYGSTYEKDLLINIENGVVVNTDIRINGNVEDENAPEGYGVSALTMIKGTSKPDGRN